MMNKFLLILLAGILFCQTAEARRYHHRHRYDGYDFATDVAAGAIGAAVGVSLADQIRNSGAKQAKPRVYIAEPEAESRCYTVVSRKTGKVTQKCVDSSADIIYVD